jgi:hypothetical protein
MRQDGSVVTALLVLVVIGLPLLGLLAELAVLDTRRSKAVADAALRRAMEWPDPRAVSVSANGDEGVGSRCRAGPVLDGAGGRRSGRDGLLGRRPAQ